MDGTYLPKTIPLVLGDKMFSKCLGWLTLSAGHVNDSSGTPEEACKG